jgi:hypothetical protein
VLRPSTTGEVSKWKIISVPLKTVTEFAGVPFTMKTLPSKPPPGALKLTVKSVGGVPTTMLPHGGELLVTEQPAGDGVGVGGTVAVGGGEAVGVAVAVAVAVGTGGGKQKISIELSGVTPSLAYPPASQM